MDEPLTKKVELLRALERSKTQFDELIETGANDEFTDKDKEFMEAFKKIYHTGIENLEVFIDKLNDEGKDLDPYSILYYVRQLLTGPLTEYTKELSQFKQYFYTSPNIMGVMGNTGRNYSSTPVFDLEPLGSNTDTFNKLPEFMQKINKDIINVSRTVFNSNFISSVYDDNTLPFIDKQTSERIERESDSGYNNVAHGNYMVKDVEFYKLIQEVSESIFNSVKEFLGDEDFRLFKFKKQLNLFDSDSNTAKSFNAPINRKLSYMDQQFDENGVEEIEIKDTTIETDLLGDTFDSIDRRSFEFKIIGPIDKKFTLSTVKGQLGSGEDIKEKNITD